MASGDATHTVHEHACRQTSHTHIKTIEYNFNFKGKIEFVKGSKKNSFCKPYLFSFYCWTFSRKKKQRNFYCWLVRSRIWTITRMRKYQKHESLQITGCPTQRGVRPREAFWNTLSDNRKSSKEPLFLLPCVYLFSKIIYELSQPWKINFGLKKAIVTLWREKENTDGKTPPNMVLEEHT